MRRSTSSRMRCSASFVFATVVRTTTASVRGLDVGRSDDISAYGRPKLRKRLSRAEPHPTRASPDVRSRHARRALLRLALEVEVHRPPIAHHSGQLPPLAPQRIQLRLTERLLLGQRPLDVPVLPRRLHIHHGRLDMDFRHLEWRHPLGPLDGGAHCPSPPLIYHPDAAASSALPHPQESLALADRPSRPVRFDPRLSASSAARCCGCRCRCRIRVHPRQSAVPSCCYPRPSAVLVFIRGPRQLYRVMPEETLIVRGAREHN